MLIYDAGYTIERCHGHLDSLVAWGNLAREYAHGRVRTIDEFRRRQALYHPTPVGIALERFLAQLEQARRQVGALDPGALGALRTRLDGIDQRLADPASLAAVAKPGPEGEAIQKELAQLWREVQVHFQRVATDGNDFLATMRRTRPETLVQHEVFLAYKNDLVGYLEGYALTLQQMAPKLHELLRRWQGDETAATLIAALAAERRRHDQPSLLPSSVPSDHTANVRGEIAALSGWFAADGGVTVLRRMAREAIQFVTRQAARLAEYRRGTVSRLGDLSQLAVLFATCRQVQQAERIASLAFAAGLPRHWRGELSQPVELAPQGAWHDPPTDIRLTPIRRGRSRREDSALVSDRRAEREALLRHDIEARRRLGARLDALFRGGELELAEVAVADSDLRDALLDLIDQCLLSPNGTATAADGSSVTLSNPETTEFGEVWAPDGVWTGPRFRLLRQPARIEVARS